jgi:hypothetical protein
METVYSFLPLIVIISVAVIVGLILMICLKFCRSKKKTEISEEIIRIEQMQKNGKITKDDAEKLKETIKIKICKKQDANCQNIRIHIAVVASIQIFSAIIFGIPICFFVYTEKTGFSNLAILLLIIAIPIISTVFLIKRKTWARVILIIFSIVMLVHFPIGTILGIYSLYVLCIKCGNGNYEQK